MKKYINPFSLSTFWTHHITFRWKNKLFWYWSNSCRLQDRILNLHFYHYEGLDHHWYIWTYWYHQSMIRTPLQASFTTYISFIRNWNIFWHTQTHPVQRMINKRKMISPKAIKISLKQIFDVAWMVKNCRGYKIDENGIFYVLYFI